MWHDNHFGKPQNCTIGGLTCPLKMHNVTSQQRVYGEVRSNNQFTPNFQTSGLFRKPILYQIVSLLHAIAFANTFPLDLGTSLIKAYNSSFVHLDMLLGW